MIHVRASLPSNTNPDPVIHISLVGAEDIYHMLHILNSALNCKPEFEKSWFDLAYKLEMFIADNSAQKARNSPEVGTPDTPTGQT